ncbi:hypothetical protein TURU_132496 [Turdus rufiventris]|nr:hypothetical protein TURU_132496 [Turdus rufiventris]
MDQHHTGHGGDDQSLQNSEHENKDVTEKKCVKQIIGNNHSLGKKSKRKTSGLWEKAEDPHLKKGVTHSSDYCMWKKNEYASNGVRDFAEKGEAWALMKEIEEAGEKIQSVHGIFSAPAISSGTGQTSTELEAHPRHPLVSFVVRIVPSPDWFVGIDSLNLCEGDHWMDEVTVDLFPYDAGTDSGFTFSSPNFATIPQDTVTEITCSSPSHPANSFYYPKLKILPPIAQVTMVKIKKSQLGLSAPFINLPAKSNEVIDTVSGNYKVQRWDIHKHDFLESAPGLGMFVTVTTPTGERLHLDIRIGEHFLDESAVQAKDKVNEVHDRLEHLIEQIHHVTREQDYERTPPDIQSLFMRVEVLCKKWSKEESQVSQFQERYRKRLVTYHKKKIAKLEESVKKAAQEMRQLQWIEAMEVDPVPSPMRRLETPTGPTRLSLISPPQDGRMGSISYRQSQTAVIIPRQKAEGGSTRIN